MTAADARQPQGAAATDPESIDFNKLIQALWRQWPLLLACVLGGGGTAALLTARLPRIWQAEFQIVLSVESPSSMGAMASQFNNLVGMLGAGSAGGGSSAGSQETEMKVLQSPSVLLPVFEFLKQQQDPAKSNQLSYPSWAGGVGVKAERGTSVLNVTYQGTDPALVLATSRKISQTYQVYAGRKRLRSLRSLIDYLSEQILLFTPKADASRRAAEAFANRYALTSADSAPTSGSAGGSLNLSSGAGGLGSLLSGIASSGASGSGSLKSQEAALNKQIFELQYQLERVRRAGDGEPMALGGAQAPVLSNLIGNLSNNGSLQDIDRLIAERRSRFQDNDPIVTSLQRQRRVLIAASNRQLAAEIKNSIDLARSQLASVRRPAGVIEEFQELSRQANRDESTLLALENNLASQKLDEARDAQPWELISTPTLLDRPISPQPMRNLAIGLLAGAVLGGAGALVRDRRSGLVFHLDELLDLLPYPLLGQLNSAHSGRWAGVLDLLAHGPLAGCPQVALIEAGSLGERAEHFARALEVTLQQQDPAAQVLLTSDLITAGRCQVQLLVGALGVTKREALQQLAQDLSLQARPVAGLVLLIDPRANDDA